MRSRFWKRVRAASLAVLLLQVSVLHAAAAPSCLGHLGPMGPGMHAQGHGDAASMEEGDRAASHGHPLNPGPHTSSATGHSGHSRSAEAAPLADPGANGPESKAAQPGEAADCGCSGMCQCESSSASRPAPPTAGSVEFTPLVQALGLEERTPHTEDPVAFLVPPSIPPPSHLGSTALTA